MATDPQKIEADFLAEEQFDANDPQSVNRRKQRIAREKKEHLNFVAKILKDPEGRKWLHRVIAAGEVCSVSYSASEDERSRDFRDGMKHISAQIMADAKAANLELFFLMLREGEANKLDPILPMNGIL